MIIDEGNEIALATFAVDRHGGPVQHVGLPQIIGEFGLEAPPVDRSSRTAAGQALSLQDAIRGGEPQGDARRHQVLLLHLDQQPLQRCGGLFGAEFDQGADGFIIDGAAFAAVGAGGRRERRELAATGLVAPNPADRAGGEAGALRVRNVPALAALLFHQTLELTILEPCGAHEVTDDPEPKQRHFFALDIVHTVSSFCGVDAKRGWQWLRIQPQDGGWRQGYPSVG
jgi:hypothetical protein